MKAIAEKHGYKNLDMTLAVYCETSQQLSINVFDLKKFSKFNNIL